MAMELQGNAARVASRQVVVLWWRGQAHVNDVVMYSQRGPAHSLVRHGSVLALEWTYMVVAHKGTGCVCFSLG
jgi:hypothetical protein